MTRLQQQLMRDRNYLSLVLGMGASWVCAPGLDDTMVGGVTAIKDSPLAGSDRGSYVMASGAHVTRPTPADLAPAVASGDLTMGAWFRTTSTAIMCLIGNRFSGSTADRHLGLLINFGTSAGTGRVGLRWYRELLQNMQGGVNSNTGISDGNWHLVVATLRSGGSHMIDLDGAAQSVTVISQGTHTPVALQPSLAAGARAVDGGTAELTFTGDLPIAFCIPRALTAAERTTLYLAAINSTR